MNIVPISLPLSDGSEETKIVSEVAQNGWSNPPSLRVIKQNVVDGALDDEVRRRKVDGWLRLRENRNVATKKTTGSKVNPKVIRKQAEWRYSSLSEPFLSTEDIFNATPTSSGDKARAEQDVAVLNKHFNTKIGKVSFIDNVVRDDVDLGTVCIKSSWKREVKIVEEEQPIYEYILDQEGVLAEQYTALLEMMNTDNDAYAEHSTPGLDKALAMFQRTGLAYAAVEVGSQMEKVEKVLANHAVYNVVDTRNIIISPDGNGNYKNASAITELFPASKASLQADGRYFNLDNIHLAGVAPKDDPDYVSSTDLDNFSLSDPTRKTFIVRETWCNWDIHGDGVLYPIVVAWVNNTIIRMSENPFPHKEPPFSLATYMPIRGSVHGEPDAELIEDNQKIVGAITRGMIDLLGKSANSLTGMRKGFLDVTNKRRYLKNLPYEFNSNSSPDANIYTHKFPEIPTSAYNMLNMINADSESLTGVKAYSSGITGGALAGTATGVRGVLDAASKREVGILRRLAEAIIDVGRKTIAMNSVWLSPDEVTRITNKPYIKPRKDDPTGGLDLTLTISTPEEDNKKAEELAFMLQTQGPNQNPELSVIIQAEIATLRKMPHLAKKLLEYEPQPDPIAQEKARLEIVLLEAQIAKENALAAKHSAEVPASSARAEKDIAQAELNYSKTGTEQSKSREAHSKANALDLSNRDVVTGTKHKRDLEIEDNKAHNAATLKVMDKDLAQ